jgi:hypothetical protein
VLASVGLVGAAALVVGLSVASIAAGTVYVQKFGNLTVNLRNMRAWVAAGKPEWKQGDDKVFRMTPTTEIKRLPG